ncbi:MAG: serine protease [Chloroflexi bacterium]|nr:serine protease [Chloroflexota bacterium]
MSALQEIQSTISDLAQRVAPAVVRIEGGWRGASGVVVASGQVMTNAHNVRDQAVDVTFNDGRRAPGTVAGIDADGDLAVITVETGAVEPIEWISDDGLALGRPVFALSASSQGSRITFGLVSSVARAFRGPRGRRISGSIEHTAPMARGSSGSALVDEQVRLVGLNTNRVGGGFYLALPADQTLRSRVQLLAQGGPAERPHLGVGIAPGQAARRMRRAVGLPERAGLLVRDVEEGSAAARSGIAEGDLLVSAAGRPLDSVDDLYDVLRAIDAAGRLELVIVRGSDERVVSVDLAPQEG